MRQPHPAEERAAVISIAGSVAGQVQGCDRLCVCACRGRIEGILGLYGKCVLESRDEFCVLNTNKSHCERKKLSCRCVCVCVWVADGQTA